MRRRPSGAMVVALVALVVGSVGSATAASVLITDSSQVKRGSINSGDLTNGRGVNVADLTARAKLALKPKAGPRGPDGERGAQGPAGARGEAGPPGQPGADGTAVAFAYVKADGTLDQGNSKGINSVSHPQQGIYCFDLGPTVRNAVATADATSGPGSNSVFPLGALPYPTLPTTGAGQLRLFSDCPTAQRDAEVRMLWVYSATFEDVPFWVSFN
jgi:hypothetical protein